MRIQALHILNEQKPIYFYNFFCSLLNLDFSLFSLIVQYKLGFINCVEEYDCGEVMNLSDRKSLMMLDEHVLLVKLSGRLRLGMLKIISISEFTPPKVFAFFYDFVSGIPGVNHAVGVIKEKREVVENYGSWSDILKNDDDFKKLSQKIIIEKPYQSLSSLISVLTVYRAYLGMFGKWPGTISSGLKIKSAKYSKMGWEEWPEDLVKEWILWSLEEEKKSIEEVTKRRKLAKIVADKLNNG